MAFPIALAVLRRTRNVLLLLLVVMLFRRAAGVKSIRLTGSKPCWRLPPESRQRNINRKLRKDHGRRRTAPCA